MLRAVFVSTIASLSILGSFLGSPLGQAIAGPLLGDDVATCRERQTDVKVRLDACERVIAAGQAAKKDLAVALPPRGDAPLPKRDHDNPIPAPHSPPPAPPP